MREKSRKREGRRDGERSSDTRRAPALPPSLLPSAHLSALSRGNVWHQQHYCIGLYLRVCVFVLHNTNTYDATDCSLLAAPTQPSRQAGKTASKTASKTAGKQCKQSKRSEQSNQKQADQGSKPSQAKPSQAKLNPRATSDRPKETNGRTTIHTHTHTHVHGYESLFSVFVRHLSRRFVTTKHAPCTWLVPL